MMLLSLPLLFGLAAHADGPACVACCKQEGLVGCPTRLSVFGDGSLATPEGPGWRVIGIWWLDCEDGADFKSGQTVVLDHQPVAGEVLRLASPPSTVQCFERACALPAGACLHQGPDDVFTVERCSDGRPLSDSEMRVRGAMPVTQAPAPPQVHPGYGQPTTAVIPPQAETQSGVALDFDLPDPPGDTCDTSDLLRAESRRHVDVGDESRVAGLPQDAIDEYRAALSMDRCNPYAWAALGEAALRANQPTVAVRALRVATRLQPKHYGAWTNLGKAYELQGRTALAAEAYRQALALQPGHPDAVDGLLRVRGIH